MIEPKKSRSFVLHQGAMIVTQANYSFVIPSWETYVEELGKIDAIAAKTLLPWVTNQEKEELFKEIEVKKDYLTSLRKILDEQDHQITINNKG